MGDRVQSLIGCTVCHLGYPGDGIVHAYGDVWMCNRCFDRWIEDALYSDDALADAIKQAHDDHDSARALKLHREAQRVRAVRGIGDDEGWP